MCAELADLAMQLARAAAARALAESAEPQQSPATAEPEPMQPAEPESIQPAEPESIQPAEPESIQSPELQLIQWQRLYAQSAEPQFPQLLASRRATSHSTTSKPTDPATLFTRLAAVVRDCIALEARLAAGIAAARPSTRASALHADPRRVPLRDALRFVIKNHPDRADLTSDANSRLDAELLDDPDQTIEPGELLSTICNSLGIEIDYATLPDEYLFAGDELDNPSANFYQEDPRATSPP